MSKGVGSFSGLAKSFYRIIIEEKVCEVKTLGEQIDKAVKDSGWEFEDVASFIGVWPITLRRWRHGTHYPTRVRHNKALAMFLGGELVG